jgi:hypothetical protein
MHPLIDRFAKAGHVLPVAALREADARWEEVAPALLASLEAFAAGTDRSDDAATACFFIAFLAAQKREVRAFPLLCRLGHDGDAMEAMLGDGVTENLGSILADTWDGDLASLLALAGDGGADEYVRNAAFQALATLAVQGRIARDAMEAALHGLHARMLAGPKRQEMAWVGWVDAVATLGLERLAPQAHQVFSRGLIARMLMGRKHFDAHLAKGMAAETPAEKLDLVAGGHPTTIEDAVALLSGWHGFSKAAQQEAAARERRLAEARLADAMRGDEAIARDFPRPIQPAAPPAKVGRNDPCPCGSGRKFKTCCLAA